jgi:anti-sigma B factor antagonist
MSGSPVNSDPTIETRTTHSDAVVVALGGEHDLASAAELEQTLDRCLDVYSHLIVDISDASYIDSSTIGVLLRARRRAEDERHRFNLVLGTAPIVERILDITGVLPTLHTVPTVEQALGA